MVSRHDGLRVNNYIKDFLVSIENMLKRDSSSGDAGVAPQQEFGNGYCPMSRHFACIGKKHEKVDKISAKIDAAEGPRTEGPNRGTRSRTP